MNQFSEKETVNALANVIINDIKPYVDKYGCTPTALFTRTTTDMKMRGELNNHGVKVMIKEWYDGIDKRLNENNLELVHDRGRIILTKKSCPK